MKTRKELIDAVQWYFGFTKKDARDYIKGATPETIENILICYYNECLKSFRND